jgi:hypothetical protein
MRIDARSRRKLDILFAFWGTSMTDDPSSPSVKRDGRLVVHGASAPLERDTARMIYFDALDLHRFFESFQSKTTSRIRFARRVVLEKDSIGIAGENDLFENFANLPVQFHHPVGI